jgi:hypothetical protein
LNSTSAVLREGAILCFSQITVPLVAPTPSRDLFGSARDLFDEANVGRSSRYPSSNIGSLVSKVMASV